MSEDGYPDAQPWDAAEILEDEEGNGAILRAESNLWAVHSGRKAPRSGYNAYEPTDSSGDEAPDLGAFFEEWDMPVKDQVIMCRAYASMLSASSKAQPKKNKKE